MKLRGPRLRILRRHAIYLNLHVCFALMRPYRKINVPLLLEITRVQGIGDRQGAVHFLGIEPSDTV